MSLSRFAALATAALLATTACSGSIGGEGEDGDETGADTLTIGFVTAATGPLAGFGEANDFVIGEVEKYFAEHPLTVGGQEVAVRIVVKDSQSDSTRAGQVAAELINSDGADILMAASTPDVSNPVSEQCEANSIPCLTSVAPWQPFAIRDGQAPADLKYSYHFFWGLEDVAAVYQDIWSQVPNNGRAGGLFPNDPDGTAWSGAFPGLVEASGVKITDPGLYTTGTKDFSAQISRFKGSDILLGVPISPDFTTFWQQAQQQGYRPQVATVGKALLFPSAVEAIGESANGLTTEVWWHPDVPYTSSLTGQSAQELANAYTDATAGQWTQPIGFAHALFEVAAAAVQKAGSTEPDAIVEALGSLEVSTVVGNLAWGADSSVPPYVAKTPLLGGQWQSVGTGPYPFTLVVVSNQLAPGVPVGGEVEPLG